MGSLASLVPGDAVILGWCWGLGVSSCRQSRRAFSPSTAHGEHHKWD